MTIAKKTRHRCFSVEIVTAALHCSRIAEVLNYSRYTYNSIILAYGHKSFKLFCTSTAVRARLFPSLDLDVRRHLSRSPLTLYTTVYLRVNPASPFHWSFFLFYYYCAFRITCVKRVFLSRRTLNC
jgi:hypothetical protein